jgi:hypothetical protein
LCTVRSSEEGRDPVHDIFEVLCRREKTFETPLVKGARADMGAFRLDSKYEIKLQSLQIDSVLWRSRAAGCKSVRVLRSFFRYRFGWSSIVTESRFGLFGTHIGILLRVLDRRRKLPRPNSQIR